MFSRSLLYFQEQLPPYSLYDFPRYKFHNTDTHVLYNINNNHLDKLQENLMKELIELEKQVTEETRELLVSLDEKQKKLIFDSTTTSANF
jgi:hypothetical protein